MLKRAADRHSQLATCHRDRSEQHGIGTVRLPSKPESLGLVLQFAAAAVGEHEHGIRLRVHDYVILGVGTPAARSIPVARLIPDTTAACASARGRTSVSATELRVANANRGSVVATDAWGSVESKAGGGCRRLASVGDIEFDQYVGDVGAHGAGAEEERLGDLLIRLVLGQQAQDVDLARRETSWPLGWALCRGRGEGVAKLADA